MREWKEEEDIGVEQGVWEETEREKRKLEKEIKDENEMKKMKALGLEKLC